MDKAELRSAIRAARRAGHTPAPDAVQRVMEHIPDGASVCAYVSLPGEPPTPELIEELLATGHEVYLPVAHSRGRMTWVRAADSRPWQAWGLPGNPTCPAADVVVDEVDIALIPALAVTAQGARLGQGGGYYDRFLAGRPARRTIALVWSDEILPDVHAEPHDVPVDDWVVLDG